MGRTPFNAKGRVGRPWLAVSARVYDEETHCWLCGGWVDQTLPSTHAYARSADHLVQLCHGGDPLDRDGLRLAHMRCNTARSNELRYIPVERCACQQGRPCAVVYPENRRGLVVVDPSGV